MLDYKLNGKLYEITLENGKVVKVDKLWVDNATKVFGTNVRKYRTQKKVSQEKFAELCGLHRTYISDIECFRRSISLDNIQKIATGYVSALTETIESISTLQ